MNPLRSGRPGRRRLVLFAALPLLLPLLAAEASAAGCDPSLSALPAADPGTILLQPAIDGATEVRLAGIEVPVGSGRDDARAEAYDVAVRRLMAEVLADRCIRLEPAPAGRDRYGRLPAQVYAGDVWLQGALLQAGLARVRPTPDEREHVGEMLVIERRAREAGAGLWADPAFAVRPAAEPSRIEGGFRIVEGRVLAAQRRGDLWYLNFGRQWRTDFTVTIGKQLLADFARAGIEPFALEGRPIRVRGWVQSLNGPAIDLLVPGADRGPRCARVAGGGGRSLTSYSPCCTSRPRSRATRQMCRKNAVARAA